MSKKRKQTVPDNRYICRLREGGIRDNPLSLQFTFYIICGEYSDRVIDVTVPLSTPEDVWNAVPQLYMLGLDGPTDVADLDGTIHHLVKANPLACVHILCSHARIVQLA